MKKVPSRLLIVLSDPCVLPGTRVVFDSDVKRQWCTTAIRRYDPEPLDMWSFLSFGFPGGGLCIAQCVAKHRRRCRIDLSVPWMSWGMGSMVQSGQLLQPTTDRKCWALAPKLAKPNSCRGVATSSLLR